MHQEIELQVKIENPVAVERQLKKIGKYIMTRKQVDKYFVPPYRDFFAKKPQPIEYLRIRFEKGKDHLNYSFLHFDKKGWLRTTDEYETRVEKPEIVEEIFKKIGLILKVTVVKIRKYFDCGDFEVTLDKVKGLGNFMEIEAKKNFGSINRANKACLDFLKKLNIEYELRKDMGYPKMLYRKLKKEKNLTNFEKGDKLKIRTMTTQTLKLKNQTLTLPKDWRGKEIFVKRYDDTILIKKIEKPAFWESWKKIKTIAKDIQKKDIEKAILWTRKSRKR